MRGEIINEYQKLNSEDQKTFRRWLWANGAILLLTGLAFAVPTLKPTIAEAQADVSDAANLYPGRYAAVCTPAPIFGCVCATDSPGEALMFTELDSTADHHLKDVADSEYLRMISWLRRTCESLTQPAAAR